ncbi:NACHT domain-containing protein [Streptomyces sp. NPDC101118]|uniref:NACHT domain-containing protein n=1 Tax=Streptomyces sp. NPDC101118 TaxID=3366109 RepID=UPI0037F2F206
MRFDLSRLGSQEFEHLVQSLTMAEFGPGVGVFGSGADGGREATFDGPVPVTANGHCWNGYGVIQAKYKEHTATPKENATWLIAELKGEMAGWRARKAEGKRIPSYFVVATNVRLSPQDGGGLDTVEAYFAKTAPELGLKGWLVWHFDVIGTQLANHDSVRTTYASWITPGDVLAAVLGAGGREDQAFQEALTRFTAQELLRQRYVNLDQAGSADDRNVALADIFVDLPYQLWDSGPAGQDSSRVVASLLGVGDGQSDGLGMPLAEGVEGESCKRFVLVGGPGQGKSTVTQLMCQAYRVAMLADSPIAERGELRAACTKIRTLMTAEDVPVPRNRRWPVSIQLTRLADDHAKGDVTSILGYIASMIGKRCGTPVSTTQVRSWLKRYPWFVAFDGLDEVPATSNRAQVLTLIDDFLVEADSVDADLMVMATTRPQGYTKRFSSAHYRHLHLSPLSKAIAMNYGTKLAVARHGNESDRADRLVERIERAYAEPTTAHLMSSPLQVTILAVLLDRVGQAPKDRYTLFDDYYRVIYERELEKDSQASALLRDHRPDVDVIHAQVGLLLQTRSETSGQTNSTLSVDELGVIVRDRLAREGHTGTNLEQLEEKIIKAATERLVFLVSGRADEIGFEIRSLQEFWAAQGIMQGTEEQISERLRCIASSAHWRNAILFAFGHIFAKRETMRDTVLSLVMGLNSFSEENHELGQNVLAGSRLAVDVLADGMVRAPAYASPLATQALALLKMPLDSDARNLGRCLPVHMAEALSCAAAERLSSRGDFDDATLIFTVAAFLDRADVPAEERAALEALLAALYAVVSDAVKNEALRLAHEMRNTRLQSLTMERWVEVPVDVASTLVFSPIRRRREGNGLAKTGYAPWARHYVNLLGELGGRRFRAPASMWEVDDLGVACTVTRLRPTNGRQVGLWRAVTDTVPPKVTWLHAAARFVARPSRGSLADFLAADCMDEGSLRRTLTGLPWVVGQVLAEEGDTAAAAEAVRRGDYGDFADWTELEETWDRHGDVSMLTGSLADWARDRRPLFPLVSADLSFRFDPQKDLARATEALFTDYGNLVLPGGVKPAFASLMLALLDVHSRGTSDLANQLGPAVIEAVLRDADPQEPLHVGWLSACDPIRDWKHPIARIGGRHDVFGIAGVTGARLLDEWLREPELWGLVPVLAPGRALVLPHTVRDAVRDAWRTLNSDTAGWSPEARHMAALAAALFSEPADRQEAQRLSEAVVEAVKRGPAGASRVLRAAVPGSHRWRRVMLLLCAEGLREEQGMRQHLVERLVDALAGDPSGVAEVLGIAIPEIPHQAQRNGRAGTLRSAARRRSR